MIAKAKSSTPYIPSWMIESRFNHCQLAIMTYVACRGKCFETKKSIRTKLGMAKGTYLKHVKELTKNGWLKESWHGRKKCLQVHPYGKIMNQSKPDMDQNRTLEKDQNETFDMVQNETFEKGQNETPNIPRELTKLTNQVNKPSTGSTCTDKGRGVSMTGKPLLCSQEDYDLTVSAIFNAGRERRVQ